jgi:uncharacterized protein
MSRTRRRRRRGARGSRGAIVAALIAALVVVAAVILIVRGDTTPRPAHAANHRHVRAAAAADAAPAPPLAEPTTAAAASSVPNATAEPQTEATARAASTPASQPPHQATPQPASTGTGTPRLAIIIDDCGQWLDTERGFIALPVPLTLSVLPHVRYGTQIAREAAAAGKGVMLHLPMEPDSGADPGPGRVTTAMDDAAIVAQVRDDLNAVPLAAGVNNHEGSRASSDDRVMRDVASVLAERHVFFVDSRTSAATVAERDASAAGVPTARRNVFLDDVAEVDATEAQLRRAAALAKANGSAIAIGHPRPTTLTAVRSLLPELEREGITLVLASDLVR